MLCDNPEGWGGGGSGAPEGGDICVQRGLPGAQLVKSPLQCGRPGSIPGLGSSLGEGTTTHSSILGWRIPWTTVHGVAKSQTRLSDRHLAFTADSLCRAAEASAAVKQLRAQPRSRTPMKKHENVLQTLVFFSVHIQLCLQHPFW